MEFWTVITTHRLWQAYNTISIITDKIQGLHAVKHPHPVADPTISIEQINLVLQTIYISVSV